MENNFNTGDIILCIANKSYNSLSDILYSYFDSFIQLFSNSKYTHCGMILKNPVINNFHYEGVFLWEANLEHILDIEDNRYHFGVTIIPLNQFIKTYNGKIFHRKIDPIIQITNKELQNIHDVVHDKPYDIVPMDWIFEIFKYDNKPQKTDRFWCSALLGYIYTKLGFLDKNTDWSILNPGDFSYNGSLNNKFINCTIEKEKKI